VRNKPHEGGKSIELPGGRVEEYESLLEAVRREVHEETGLDLIKIEGENTRVEAVRPETIVECLAPLAVYQTIRGPVDLMGVYFHQSRGSSWLWGMIPKGSMGAGGCDSAWLETEPERFSWVDQAGLLFT
jgi:8-oxo-dGTP pyrophosphatase MutT (NUDIX family)